MNNQPGDESQERNTSGQGFQQEIVALLVSIQEDERRRISRDLHDETGQTLMALSIVLKMIQSDLPGEYPDLRERLKAAIELAQSATDQLHFIIRDLRPPTLDVKGLKTVMEELCQSFQRYTQIQVKAQISELPAMPEPYCVTLYRCLQEALANVARHAHASQIWVSLVRVHDAWELSIKDDGMGMVDQASLESSTRQLGLVGLKERLYWMGGSVEIISQAGQGTRLLVRLPVPENQLISLE